MSNQSQRRRFFEALFGFAWGATVGSIVSLPFGFAALILVLKLTNTSGDQATGTGGLILLAVPIGFIIGGYIGARKAINDYPDRTSK